MKTTAKIEIRKDVEAGMYEVYNVVTGEVYTREQSEDVARLWVKRYYGRFSEAR